MTEHADAGEAAHHGGDDPRHVPVHGAGAARGAEADARTDIFAFGALLYEMATGRRAFEGKTKTSLIAAIVSSQPAPISSIQPLTPPAFEHVVQKCLEKDPDDRWQSAHDVASELRWISEAGSQAGRAGAVSVRRRQPRADRVGARRALAAAAAVGTAWVLRCGAALCARATSCASRSFRPRTSPSPAGGGARPSCRRTAGNWRSAVLGPSERTLAVCDRWPRDQTPPGHRRHDVPVLVSGQSVARLLRRPGRCGTSTSSRVAPRRRSATRRRAGGAAGAATARSCLRRTAAGPSPQVRPGGGRRPVTTSAASRQGPASNPRFLPGRRSYSRP